ADSLPKNLHDEWLDYMSRAILKEVSRNYQNVTHQTLNLYNRYVFQGHSADDVAEEFGVNRQEVYNAKAHLRPKVMDAVERLRDVDIEFQGL
ncbi:MAG: hypothetical protein AAF492_26545, partial [Verrucomicrobiota bacterium]